MRRGLCRLAAGGRPYGRMDFPVLIGFTVYAERFNQAPGIGRSCFECIHFMGVEVNTHAVAGGSFNEIGEYPISPARKHHKIPGLIDEHFFASIHL